MERRAFRCGERNADALLPLYGSVNIEPISAGDYYAMSDDGSPSLCDCLYGGLSMADDAGAYYVCIGWRGFDDFVPVDWRTEPNAGG